MEVSAKVGIVGAVLLLIGFVGFLGFGFNALPTLLERDYATWTTTTMYYVIGFGLVAVLGLMIWMLAILLALTKEK